MRGFIIALLPALDEEGSEFFDKVRRTRMIVIIGVVIDERIVSRY